MKPFSRERDAVASVVWIVVLILVLGIIVMSLVIYGLLTLAKNTSPEAVIWWAVIATLLAVPLFLFGFYLGKVEARGVLRGFDRSLDRMAGVIGDIVTVRDQSRIAVHNATKIPPQAQWQVNLPGLQSPIITHRRLTGGDDTTIDL